MRAPQFLLAVLLVLAGALSSVATAETIQVMTGAGIDRACGQANAQAQILQMSRPFTGEWCSERTGRCNPVQAYEYRVRCPGGSQISGVDVWWRAFGAQDITRAKVHDNTIFARTSQAAPWQSLPRGYAPLPRDVQIAQRTIAPQPAPVQRAAAPQPAPRAPHAPDPTEQLLYSFSPIWQLALFALFAFFGFVAWQGHFDVDPSVAAEARQRIGMILGFFGLGLAGSHYGLADSLAGNHSAVMKLSSLAVGVSLLFLLPYLVLRYLKRFVMGWHYTFVAHPAAPIVNTAVATQSPINAPALSHALTPSPGELAGQPAKFAFQYRSDAAKAEELKRKLDADRKMAEAAIARERALAASRDTR